MRMCGGTAQGGGGGTVWCRVWGYHTVDYGPFIKSQRTPWAVDFEDFLVQIWSRYR
jgi:hypothetical protein